MKRIFDEIKKAQSIAIIVHINPDGDCVGSAMALYNALKSDKKEVGLFCDSQMPAHFLIFEGAEKFLTVYDKDYDLYIAVDCADIGRLGGLGSKFLQAKNSINIDHHITNSRFAKINLVEDAASSAEIVYDLIKNHSDYEITPEIASCLYLGLCTDTGSFSHSNTTPRAHFIAAELMEYGFDYDRINCKFIKQRTIERTKLLATALNSIKFYCDNKIAIITLTLEDFKKAGATLRDSENIVNFAVDIEGVLIGLSISQQNPNQWKVGMRSNSDQISVAQAASYFGGGGHKRASGCMLSGNIEDITAKLVKACSDQFPF